MTTVCDNCSRLFEVSPDKMMVAILEDLKIQYFTCPHCFAKYVAFAADDEMRKLVEERKAVAQQIRAAHKKQFLEKTIQGYIAKQDKIKRRQMEILPGLKSRAERLLRDADASEVNGADCGV